MKRKTINNIFFGGLLACFGLGNLYYPIGFIEMKPIQTEVETLALSPTTHFNLSKIEAETFRQAEVLRNIFRSPEVLSVIANSIVKRGRSAIQRDHLQRELDGILSQNLQIRVNVDYRRIAQIGYALYVPVSVNGTRCYLRCFYREDAPEDKAEVIWTLDKENLRLQLLTKSKFVSATLARARHKGLFHERTLSYLSEVRRDEYLYLGMGDLDFLRRLNKIYGEQIMNAVLTEVHLAIRHRLDDIEREYELRDRIRLRFGGDEVIIGLPPSELTRAQILQLMESVRQAIKNSIHRKFGVACLQGFIQSLAELPSEERQEVLNQIDQMAVTLDPKPRRKGNLALFELKYPDDLWRSLDEFIQQINAILNKFDVSPVSATYNWLGDDRRFNDGYMWAPDLSLGLVEAEDVLSELHRGKYLQELTDQERAYLFNEILFRAEDALRVAKEERDKIVYGLYPKHIHAKAMVDLVALTNKDFSKVQSSAKIPPAERDYHDPRLMIESAFRTKVYESIQNRDSAKLIQMESVYGGWRLDEFTATMTSEEIEALRGTQKGVGLRAINELMGHEVGDLIIKAVASAIVEALPASWYVEIAPATGPPQAQDEGGLSKALPPMSRFVDRLRIYLRRKDGALPSDEEIGAVLDKAREKFNSIINGIAINQMTAVVVKTGDFTIPGIAFEKLEATSAIEDVQKKYETQAGNVVKNYSLELEPQILNYYEAQALENAEFLEGYAKASEEKRATGRAVEENIGRYLALNFGSPEFAEAWDEIFVGSSNDEFYERSRDALPESPRILDLGTGTGKALLPFAVRYRDAFLVGVDISDEMLAFARGKFEREFPYLRNEFLKADMQRLEANLSGDLRDFDAVVARFSFNFVDLETVLPQVFARLRPGGRLVFNVFAGFFWGHSDEFKNRNPFEDARIKVAKEVLEGRVLPILTHPQRAQLLKEGQIRQRPDGSWEILAEPVTQKQGLDAASLERLLKRVGFEDMTIEPVSETYPALEKQMSFLLTKSIPYYWPITNLISNDLELRIRLVQEIWDRMPSEFKQGDQQFTDIFVSVRRPAMSVARGMGNDDPSAQAVNEQFVADDLVGSNL